MLKKLLARACKDLPFSHSISAIKVPWSLFVVKNKSPVEPQAPTSIAKMERLWELSAMGWLMCPKVKDENLKSKTAVNTLPGLPINNLACILDVSDEDKQTCISPLTNSKAFAKKFFLKNIKQAKEQAQLAFEKWKESVNTPIEWKMVDSEDLSSTPPKFQKIFSNVVKKETCGFQKKVI